MEMKLGIISTALMMVAWFTMTTQVSAAAAASRDDDVSTARCSWYADDGLSLPEYVKKCIGFSSLISASGSFTASVIFFSRAAQACPVSSSNCILDIAFGGTMGMLGLFMTDAAAHLLGGAYYDDLWRKA
jgi:hypothetical protein